MNSCDFCGAPTRNGRKPGDELLCQSCRVDDIRRLDILLTRAEHLCDGIDALVRTARHVDCGPAYLAASGVHAELEVALEQAQWARENDQPDGYPAGW